VKVKALHDTKREAKRNIEQSRDPDVRMIMVVEQMGWRVLVAWRGCGEYIYQGAPRGAGLLAHMGVIANSTFDANSGVYLDVNHVIMRSQVVFAGAVRLASIRVTKGPILYLPVRMHN
jgi:hypothetical protein